MQKLCVLLAIDVLLDVFLERDADANALWDLVERKRIEGFHARAAAENVRRAVEAETGDRSRASVAFERIRGHVQVCPVALSPAGWQPPPLGTDAQADPRGELEAIQELAGAINLRLDAIVTRTRGQLYASVARRRGGLPPTCVPVLSAREVLERMARERERTPTGTNDTANLTQWLVEWRGGVQDLSQLAPSVCAELIRLAEHSLRLPGVKSELDAQALAREAVRRLSGPEPAPWQNRAHFLCDAGRAMWRSLSECAGAGGSGIGGARELDALREALGTLATLHPTRGRIAELRLVGGLSVDEAAEALGMAPAAVADEWRLVHAWLRWHAPAGGAP